DRRGGDGGRRPQGDPRGHRVIIPVVVKAIPVIVHVDVDVPIDVDVLIDVDVGIPVHVGVAVHVGVLVDVGVAVDVLVGARGPAGAGAGGPAAGAGAPAAGAGALADVGAGGAAGRAAGGCRGWGKACQQRGEGRQDGEEAPGEAMMGHDGSPLHLPGTGAGSAVMSRMAIW